MSDVVETEFVVVRVKLANPSYLSKVIIYFPFYSHNVENQAKTPKRHKYLWKSSLDCSGSF